MRILFLEGVMKSKSLKQLGIEGYIGDIDAMIKATIHMKGVAIQMKTFVMNNPDHMIRTMCQSFVDKMPNIQQISFGYMRMGARRMEMLSKGLKGHRSVKSLSLFHCYLQDKEVYQLVSEWEDDDCLLQVLKIEMNTISADGAIVLLQTSARCESLHTLSIRGSALIDEEGFQSIALELGGNLGLRWKTIDMRYCIMEAEWQPLTAPRQLLMMFQRAVEQNRNIFELQLEGNGMDEQIHRSRNEGGGIELACARNICTRYTLSSSTSHRIELNRAVSHQEKGMIWCRLIEKAGNQPSLVFWHLREQPTLLRQNRE
jgi:hypothetical protein